ncbi:hypothetical protein SISSUDRAFT_54096 [Sistotremastrum suecicum HHB10207 ss-3]|uniref:Uncharacterized protein n=1 Tax=Sistotremastrum suecicum HHB10207 ss-3 TaxID=1314776 RepID=A0A166BNW7_9AGAM|nr:hypothetical protein SISSUDRAFT_54096 [Sistotremastrum suecicum HHB10207 ss-3]
MPFSSSRMRDAVASGPNYGTNHFGDSGPSDSHDIVGLESSYTKTLGASRNAVSPKIGGLMAQRVNFVTNIHLHNSEAFTSVPTPFPAMPLSRPDTPSNDSPPARKPQDLPSIPRSDEMTQIKPRDNRPKRPRERQKPNRAKPEEDADTNDPKNPDTSMVVSQFDADTGIPLFEPVRPPSASLVRSLPML